MPIPTESVKRVCYADDITVWATDVKIPDLKDNVNSYLEIIAYLKDNSLLISAPKSTVTLFGPDPHQAKTHPRIFFEDSQLPLAQCPKILGVYLDTSLSFNKHSGYVAERVFSRNNILKALAGTSWGQQKETLLMTYKAVGRSIINYAAPVWNLCDTNYRNIQYTQNEALRTATGCHKMSSVDRLHVEPKMLKVREHSDLLSAQYLARCMEPGNVCHSITTRGTSKRRMKETLFTRHRNTVEPMMLANNRRTTLQAIHSDPINDSEKYLTRKERATLAQSRIKKDASLDATRRQTSLRLPGSSDDIDSVRPVEQTSGIQLSRGGKHRLRRTKT